MGRTVLSLQRDEQGNRSQKSQVRVKKNKSPLGNEGSQGQGWRNTKIQLAKKSFWEGKHTSGLVGKHFKDPIIALCEALKCLENPY